MPGKKELTPMQEKYCQNRALKGMRKTPAYRAAGYSANKKNKQVDAIAAFQLEKQEKIRNRIEELNSLAAAGMILNRDQLAAKLTDMVIDDSKPDGIQLKAADQLSRITGMYNDNSNMAIINNISIGDKQAYLRDLLD